jgi:hypothetical protein
LNALSHRLRLLNFWCIVVQLLSKLVGSPIESVWVVDKTSAKAYPGMNGKAVRKREVSWN